MCKEHDLLFTESHEWVLLEEDEAYIGLTEPIIRCLGEIARVETPEVGEYLEQTMECGLLEGHGFIKEMYAPLTGELIKVNVEALERPQIIVDDPYGEGWLFKVKIGHWEEVASLHTASGYSAIVENMDWRSSDLEEDD